MSEQVSCEMVTNVRCHLEEHTEVEVSYRHMLTVCTVQKENGPFVTCRRYGAASGGNQGAAQRKSRFNPCLGEEDTRADIRVVFISFHICKVNCNNVFIV